MVPMNRRRFLESSLAAGCLPVVGFPAPGRSERLTITNVELFYVAPPLRPEVLMNGDPASPDNANVPKWVFRVHTDSGIVGLGETHRMAGGPESKGAIALRRTAEALRGKNVLDFNLSRLRLPYPSDTFSFEAAFYDIAGKAVGWPVYRLLGGLAQRKVLVNYWCGKNYSPEQLRGVAERAVAGGFQGIKMKRSYPLARALGIFAKVSPKLRITVDLMGFYPSDILPAAREMEAVGNMLTFEDPVKIGDLAAGRALQEQLKTPVSSHLHINATGVRGMVDSIAAKACSVFNLGAGSMTDFVAQSYLAGEAGMPVWHGSAHELGILDAALLHCCAAAPNCTYPSDLLSYQRVDDLIVEPIRLEDSYAIVSDKPGLGVELDMDAVGRYQAKG
jgi:muconate cycloisomerase